MNHNHHTAKGIGGALSYAALAALHRPTDPARLAAEVKRLHAEQGLSARDIATALRLDHAQVINIIASPPIEDRT